MTFRRFKGPIKKRRGPRKPGIPRPSPKSNPGVGNPPTPVFPIGDLSPGNPTPGNPPPSGPPAGTDPITNPNLLPEFDTGSSTAPTRSILADLGTLGTINPPGIAEPTPREFEINLSGDQAPLAVVYGRTRVKGWPFIFETDETNVIIAANIGIGEIEKIEKIYIQGELAWDADTSPQLQDDFSAWTITTYLGTSGQTADSDLSNAIAGYSDDLDGASATSGLAKAYIVIVAPNTEISGVPQIEAIIQGLNNIEDRRTSPTTTGYSDNPSLCLANLITNSDYGLGGSVDWDSVNAAADENDDTIAGTSPAEKRRIIGHAMTRPQKIATQIARLAQYAGVWLIKRGATYVFVPDRPSSSVATFTNRHIIRSQYRGNSLLKAPNAVEISWFDSDEGIDRRVRYPAGQSTLNLHKVQLRSIPTHQQALREAEERYNRMTNEDRFYSCTVLHTGVDIEPGDVITVRDTTVGLSTDKDFRVLKRTDKTNGQIDLECREYQESTYSDSTEATPTVPDTGLPATLDVPNVTNIQEIRTSKFVDKRRHVTRSYTWTAPSNYPWVTGYLCTFEDTTNEQEEQAILGPNATSWVVTKPTNAIGTLDDTLTIKTLGFRGKESSGESYQNKIVATNPPTAPQNLSASATSLIAGGGRVSASWDAVSDALMYKVRVEDTSTSPPTTILTALVRDKEFVSQDTDYDADMTVYVSTIRDTDLAESTESSDAV